MLAPSVAVPNPPDLFQHLLAEIQVPSPLLLSLVPLERPACGHRKARLRAPSQPEPGSGSASALSLRAQLGPGDRPFLEVCRAQIIHTWKTEWLWH